MTREEMSEERKGECFRRRLGNYSLSLESGEGVGIFLDQKECGEEEKERKRRGEEKEDNECLLVP